MSNPVNALNNAEIVEQNASSNSNLNISQNKAKSNLTVPQKIEHPAIFLMRKLSEAVIQIYNDMGLGTHIDYDV